MTTVVAAAALVTGLLLQPGVAELTPLILQVTYSDGRTVPHTVGPGLNSSWTPMFPRIPRWLPQRGALPATAVEYSWVRIRESAGVRVQVTVRFGTPHQEERLVANVIVGPDAPVRVTELRNFGIEPVELSLAVQEQGSIVAPAVFAKTTGIEVVSIEPILELVPRYRVTVRNVRDVGALSFRHEWYAGGSLNLSGRQGERSGESVVAPRGTFSFDVRIPAHRNMSGGGWQARPIDAFAITSILWADWTVEGDPESAGQALVLQLARRAQLKRVVQIYRELLQNAGAVEAIQRRLIARVDALPKVADAGLITIAQSLHPATESLSVAAIDATLAAGLQDVKNHLRIPPSADSAHRPLDASTLAGLLRDGLTAAET